MAMAYRIDPSGAVTQHSTRRGTTAEVLHQIYDGRVGRAIIAARAATAAAEARAARTRWTRTWLPAFSPRQLQTATVLTPRNLPSTPSSSRT